MVEKKSKESQAEISRLAQSAQLSGREREARIEQTRQQLAQWDKIGKSAKDIMGRMEALKRPQAPTTA
jgi:hypothetical protein